jgi:predicted nucleic acid-binding Zn ribbon protein
LGRWSTVREVIGTGGIPLGELHRAGEVADRVSASVAMMTTALLEPTPRRRRPIRLRATARVTRGRAGWLALLDTRRLLARWPELVVAVCFAPLVGSVTRVAGRDWGCVVLTVLAYALASRLARWFFAWKRLAEPEVPGAVQ